ncbi:D-Tyr tRNAtyr deacylase-like domain-containing protein [Mycena leptocephala]|nr:D-Tyr tRNAtyr deacylase-like domain-containing protein [Mycena leptocephala]
MRAVVQRVSSASVSDFRGLMVLIDDTESDVSTLTNKISPGVFRPNDSTQMWKTSVKDADGDILAKGNKPDFHNAMPTEKSRALYLTFLEMLRQSYKPEKVQDGKFGAMMNVSLTNEGPVTFTLDSRRFEYTPVAGPGSTKQPKSQTSGDSIAQ